MGEQRVARLGNAGKRLGGNKGLSQGFTMGYN